MLSARRAFEGETVTDTLAKILERERDWQQLPPRTPGALRKLLQRCLTKNPKDRLQAIGDARMPLQELIADPAALDGEVEIAAYPLWKRALPWAAAPLFLAAGLLWRKPVEPFEPAMSRFEQVLPANQVLATITEHGVELSPDGKRMAFVANKIGDPDGQRRIYVKSLDQWDAVPLPGTEGGQNPFFSPDGQWLGFVQGLQIKKVALAGGTPTVLVENLVSPQGAGWVTPGITWGKNGTIVFPNNLATGLTTVRDGGATLRNSPGWMPRPMRCLIGCLTFFPTAAVCCSRFRYTTITPTGRVPRSGFNR
jgi:serine/threonine-protein kinase